jgi:endonuclease VIII-like 1
MPELAEVKLTSEFVNKHANKIYVSLEKSPVSKVKTDLNELNTNRFVIKSLSRGKEMIIDFGDMNLPAGGSYQTKRMKITLGMSGAWIYYDPRNPDNEKWHKHTHLRLTDERGNILGLYDVRRFAKWSWGNFDDQRSPCPFIESDEFRDNLLENWCTHKDFKTHTLSEILMSQKWFNGVGNYLRAEILYRLDRNPFMIASELHSEDLKVLIDLTISCVKQAYKLGGGQLKDWKNPDGEDPTHFKEWMKCYGRLEKSTDKTGRTFWHDKKWSF